jgi:hypothetical protein
MPNKRANVKNEKQYEKLKEEGLVQGACGEDRELARRLEPRRQQVRLRLSEPLDCPAGRDDGAEESRRPQGRQGQPRQEPELPV